MVCFFAGMTFWTPPWEYDAKLELLRCRQDRSVSTVNGEAYAGSERCHKLLRNSGIGNLLVISGVGLILLGAVLKKRSGR